ncbi:hypothetical protein HDU98_000566 [Podochytrium sp. JEL0797]|nr:hypothetical protein HDU98_000566 [Podochytrium sp. JEL0797]
MPPAKKKLLPQFILQMSMTTPQETFHGFLKDQTDAMILIQACISGALQPLSLPFNSSCLEIQSGTCVVTVQKNDNQAYCFRWRDSLHWTASKLTNENFMLYRQVQHLEQPIRKRLYATSKQDRFHNGSLRRKSQLIDGGLAKRSIGFVGSDGFYYRATSYFYPSDVEHFYSDKPRTEGTLDLQRPSQMPFFDQFRATAEQELLKLDAAKPLSPKPSEPRRVATPPPIEPPRLAMPSWIRDRADAILVVEATIRGQLQSVLPYMHSSCQIRSGSVVVFTQKSSEAHSIRWRDGGNWTTSKLSESFLLYREAEPIGSPYRGRETCSLYPAGTLRPGTQLVPDGMCKRTITLTGSDGLRYRVISYFRPIDVEHHFFSTSTRGFLMTPSLLPEFETLRVALQLTGTIPRRSEVAPRVGRERSPTCQQQAQQEYYYNEPRENEQHVQQQEQQYGYHAHQQQNMHQYHSDFQHHSKHSPGCPCGGLPRIRPIDSASRDLRWLKNPVLAPLETRNWK